jgi:TetR/AcrR family transcriptional regulator, cholesterol catabolism regulator
MMGSRKTKNGTYERRYEEIVHIAGELFAEKGFAGTSLNDIADAVGVLKGSLYHHISSKEDLLFDVVKVAHAGLLENTRFADNFSDDPAHHLSAFSYGHIFFNAVIERIHRGIVFLQDSKFLSVKKRAIVTKDRDNYDRYLRAIVARGQETKQFDSELDVRICSFEILGVLTSYIRWYKPGGQITPHLLGREAAAFVLASVASQSQRQSVPSRFTVVDDVIRDTQRLRDASAT